MFPFLELVWVLQKIIDTNMSWCVQKLIPAQHSLLQDKCAYRHAPFPDNNASYVWSPNQSCPVLAFEQNLLIPVLAFTCIR
jgi:hypothetical protein